MLILSMIVSYRIGNSGEIFSVLIIVQDHNLRPMLNVPIYLELVSI